MPAAVKEYRARIDSKKRLTIRGAESRDFRVVHRKDGSILLKPVADTVSRVALRAMDKAVRNLRAGNRSKPADIRKYASFAK